ncbi:MAG: hypothetical protein Q7T33_12790 [Dehalococcoidia bacterium]|nr:hypothetical protein [Dehalococcoidia bacterium]
MRYLSFLVAIGVSLLVLGALSTGALTRGVSAAQVVIAADDFYFCSSDFESGVCETTVTVGDTVKWEVGNGFHTVTQCDASFATCPPAGGFDSGNLTTGQDFEHTFDTPGTIPYRCNQHPTQMRGRITVVAAQATATPTPAATATPGASGTPGASPAATATPARAPAGGGPPSSGGDAMPWTLLAALAGALLLGASAGLALRAVRSR